MSSKSSYSSSQLLIASITASLATVAIQKLLQNFNQSTRRAPKRCAGAIKLKEDQFDTYTQLHDYPWVSAQLVCRGRTRRMARVWYFPPVDCSVFLTVQPSFLKINAETLQEKNAAQTQSRY